MARAEGTRLTRQDALEKATGAARYLADLAFPGLAHVPPYVTRPASDSVCLCLWLFPLERGEEILELTAREVLPRL